MLEATDYVTPDLPQRATPLMRSRLQIGGWVEQVFDAEMTVGGVRWLRVYRGFGDGRHHHREDWCADVPELNLHVGRYLKESHWMNGRADIETAIQFEVERAIAVGRQRLREKRAEVEGIEQALAALTISREA